MKLNYPEIMKLDTKIQVAIFHNPDNVNLQQAFPQCFSEEGSSQIPWSLINSDGFIGKFAWDTTEDGYGPRLDDGYFGTLGIPCIGIHCDSAGKDPKQTNIIIVPDNDPFWYDELWEESPENDKKNFRPFMYEINGQLLLIVGYLLHQYAYGIPLAVIDFSK
jgi:hypothetical protein